MSKPEIALLITDLDNTLWDWVDMWGRSFSALIDTVERESGVSRDRLEAEMRAVHQRHRTAEYPFVLDEVPSLLALHEGSSPKVVYDEAMHAYYRERRDALRLYPLVEETLRSIKAEGTRIVAYTESLAFYTAERIKRTGLDGTIDFLYSPPDHELPHGVSPEQLRTYPEEYYQLVHTEHRHTPGDHSKPDSSILKEILAEQGVPPERACYVGDKLMKDVAMAQDAGVHDVYAEYGVGSEETEAYALLRRVTHWTNEDVAREQKLTKKDIIPTYTLQESFTEITELFRFVPAGGTSS